MMKRVIQGFGLVFILIVLWPVPASGQEQPPNLYLPIIITFPEHTNSLILIPAGRFKMGCDETLSGQICYPNELPLHTVDLPAFEIQKFEVTNGEYKKCVDAGSCSPPGRTYTRTQTDYFGNPGFANYPVLYLSWFQARDYCSWTGMRLPTEAEWEKAARGSHAAPIFPWGSDPFACERANASFCTGDTTPVGLYPLSASPYGVMDMSGNVWEWVSDWYDGDYYSRSPLNNPSGPSSGEYKIIRGGSWFHGSEYARVSFRFRFEGGRIASFGLGFRCARSVTQDNVVSGE